MTRTCSLSLCALAVVLALASPAACQGPALAVGAPYLLAQRQLVADGVWDEAGLFSPQTVAQAQEKVRQLRTTYGCNVLLDTVSQAPPTGWARANSWIGRVRAAFFHTWAAERARTLEFHGLHILICARPRHVTVLADRESGNEELDASECAGLERLLTRQLAVAPDTALLQALTQLGQDLHERHTPEPPSLFFGPLGVSLLGGVSLWVLLLAVSWRLQRSAARETVATEDAVRLQACTLASRFGHPCGYWIIDRLAAQALPELPRHRAEDAFAGSYRSAPPRDAVLKAD